MNKQRGFTLIELLIASTLGLFVIGGFLAIFLSNSQAYRVQQSVESFQEDARFVLNRIVSLTQNTGYLGCYGGVGGAGMENLLSLPNSVLWNLDSPIQGFNDASASLDVGGIVDFVEETDVLLLKRMSGSVQLNANATVNDLTVDTSGQTFSTGHIMIVADCDKASIFQATGVSDDAGTTTIVHGVSDGFAPGNTTGTMNNSYNSGAEMGELKTQLFYLKQGSNGRSALFEGSLTVTSGTNMVISENELLPNVEDLQITYGEDTNDDQNIDFYRNADDVVDWENVLSMQLSLLMSSEKVNIGMTSNSYSFDAANFTYTKDATPSGDADTRLRRVVTGSGSFRNRTL